MNSQRVSVAIGTHNGAPFIEEQLRSILNQTIPPDEIVISDDASTDGTIRVARSVFEKHESLVRGVTSTLRVIENPVALGIAANFQQALMASTGDLIALSDQDDVWEPGRLEAALREFTSRPELDLLHSDAILVDSNGDPIGGTLFEAIEVSEEMRRQIHDGRALKVLMRRNVVTGATVVIRRRLLLRATPFPSSWLHDEWLAIVAAATGTSDLSETPLVRYRQHASNEIGARRLGFMGKVQRMLEPGGARTARLLARADELVERFASGAPEVSPEVLAAARDKLAHEQLRSSLKPRRAARIVPVLREWSTGRYSTYGRGAVDLVRDVLQPLNALR